MTLCTVCHSKTDAMLCKRCTAKLEQVIAELPADLRDLQLVATRQAIGPLGVNRYRLWDGPLSEGSLGDAPWDFAPGADDQLWAASNTITTWIRHLCETRGLEPPLAQRGTYARRWALRIDRNRIDWVMVGRVFTPSSEQPLGPLALWLLNNLDAIRHDEAAEQIYDELTGLHVENERWILGRSGLEVFAGRCDATQVGFDLDASGALIATAVMCGANLMGRDGEADVRCPSCGTRYPLAERLADIHTRQINDQLARAHLIADALTTDERPFSRDRLRKWIQRDAVRSKAPEGPACISCEHAGCRLIRRPPIHARGKDDEGHPVYRVGDVRRRLDLMDERRGVRLSV